MWGTYGDSFAGACIQFWHDLGRSVIHQDARPVLYTAESRTELLVQFMNDDGAIPMEALGALFYLTKSPDWAEEQEWRIVTLATSQLPESDRQVVLPASNIRRIFLGPRIPSEKRETIEKIASHHLHEWGVFSINVDEPSGAATFSGLEATLHPDDLEFWLSHRRQ